MTFLKNLLRRPTQNSIQARNSLMFAPDADSSPYHRPESARVDADLKGVSYTGTRLPEHEHSLGDSTSVCAPPSPTRSRIDAAITGTPCEPFDPIPLSDTYLRQITPAPPKSKGFHLSPIFLHLLQPNLALLQ